MREWVYRHIVQYTDYVFGLVAEGLALLNDRREWRRRHGR